MIRTTRPILVIMLRAAGIFPTLERRFGWRSFSKAPPVFMAWLLAALVAPALSTLAPI